MKICLTGALAALAASGALASEPAPADAPPPVEPAPAIPACDCVTVPALTPVSLEIMADLGSKTSKSGDSFPIRLSAPVVIDGVPVIAEGAEGMGEVVHAKKSGGMGAAGELVLAARWVQPGEQRLRLRSLKVVPQGQSRINTVNAINAGSAASPLPVGLIGFFISGGQAVVPKGTLAEARTAEVFTVPRTALPQAENIQAREEEKPDEHE